MPQPCLLQDNYIWNYVFLSKHAACLYPVASTVLKRSGDTKYNNVIVLNNNNNNKKAYTRSSKEEYLFFNKKKKKSIPALYSKDRGTSSVYWTRIYT